MKTLNKELLGFEVPIVGIAETLDELVAACGSKERVVDLANAYVLFHQHYTKGRNAIIDVLVKQTGKSMEADEKGKVTEKDLEYVGRIEEELGPEGLVPFEAAVVAAMENLPVDYAQPVRGTGVGAVVAKKWLAAYDDLVQRGKVDAFVDKYGVDLDGLDEDGKKLAIAKKIKEEVTRAQAAAMSAATDL